MQKIRQADVWKLKPQAEKDSLRVLTPDEYYQFFGVIDNPDHMFFFKFLFGTGMRIEEARQVKTRHINLDRREITVIRSKTGKYGSKGQRKVRFSSMLKMEIRQRIKFMKLGPDDTLGTPTRQRLNLPIKYYGMKAGLQNVQDLKTHTCRKTHENYLVAMGVDSMIVSIHMGHSLDVAYYYYMQKAMFDDEEKTKIRGIMGDIY
jgi:integrase